MIVDANNGTDRETQLEQKLVGTVAPVGVETLTFPRA